MKSCSPDERLIVKRKNLPVPLLAAPDKCPEHAGEARESKPCPGQASDDKGSDSPAGKTLSDSEVGSMLCPCCGGYESHRDGCDGIEYHKLFSV